MILKNTRKDQNGYKVMKKSNVNVGLATGFQGRAQIRKECGQYLSMMAEMLTQKIGHLKAGANTAWVPSPTAATLHAPLLSSSDVKRCKMS